MARDTLVGACPRMQMLPVIDRQVVAGILNVRFEADLSRVAEIRHGHLVQFFIAQFHSDR